MPSSTFYPIVSADDGYEDKEGVVDSSASNYWCAYRITPLIERNGLVRFRNVTIPKDSAIQSAYIRVYVPGLTYDDPFLYIYANDVDNAADLVAEEEVTDRVRTTAEVPWTEDSIGGDWANSPDITDVIQEIVSRGGWVSGNALAVLLIYRVDSTRLLELHSVDHDPSCYTELHVVYVTPYRANEAASDVNVALREDMALVVVA